MNFRLLIVCVALVGGASAAFGADILDADVQRDGDRYRVAFAVVLDGEPERLWEIVTDYPRLAELSPTVERSRVISGSSGRDARVELVLRPCVLVVFCKRVTKISDADVGEDDARVIYTVVPALSDFHEARETVVVEEVAAGVRFTYSAVLKPKFSVPPFVGPWLVRRAIIQNLKATSQEVARRLTGEAHTDD